jgi:hypothetical protein
MTHALLTGIGALFPRRTTIGSSWPSAFRRSFSDGSSSSEALGPVSQFLPQLGSTQCNAQNCEATRKASLKKDSQNAIPMV